MDTIGTAYWFLLEASGFWFRVSRHENIAEHDEQPCAHMARSDTGIKGRVRCMPFRDAAMEICCDAGIRSECSPVRHFEYVILAPKNSAGVDVYFEGYGFKEGVGTHSYIRFVDRSTGKVYVGRGGPADKNGKGTTYPDGGRVFGNVLFNRGFPEIRLKGFAMREWTGSSEARRIAEDGLKIAFSQHLVTLPGSLESARAQYNDFAAKLTGLDLTYRPLTMNSNTFAADAAITLYGADPASLPGQYGTTNSSLIAIGVDPSKIDWGAELPVGAP